MTTGLVTACLGFLLGIVWMDLIFDVQTARGAQKGGSAREEALAALAAYYRHATGGMRVLSNLIAVVMLCTLASLVLQLVQESAPRWVSVASLLAAGIPIARVSVSTLPAAVKLGSAAPERRARLAYRVLLDHVVAAFGLILAILVQLLYAH